MPPEIPSLAQIEAATLKYAEERSALGKLVETLNDKMDRIKKDALPEIRKAVNRTAEKQSVLQALIEAAKDLFLKPRTQIFHGIKIGFNKGKGKVECGDIPQLVERVRKQCPKEFDTLFETHYKPIADNFGRLDAATLRKLGVNIIEADDQVVIKATDSGVDKIVAALLKEAEGKED